MPNVAQRRSSLSAYDLHTSSLCWALYVGAVGAQGRERRQPPALHRVIGRYAHPSAPRTHSASAIPLRHSSTPAIKSATIFFERVYPPSGSSSFRMSHARYSVLSTSSNSSVFQGAGRVGDAGAGAIRDKSGIKDGMAWVSGVLRRGTTQHHGPRRQDTSGRYGGYLQRTWVAKGEGRGVRIVASYKPRPRQP